MKLSSLQAYRPQLLEVFCWSNLAFLAVDVYLAHEVNRFREHAEWVPVVFSAAVALLLGLTLLIARGRPEQGLHRWTGLITGGISLVIGISGLIYHLESRFFSEMSIRSLVYTAPFMAPLAYAGLGFLLLMNRMVDAGRREWGQWVVFFALGGFWGNFVLTLCDHAQNGFFEPSEWIAVAAAALATGFLLVAMLAAPRRPLVTATIAVMLLQMAVGVLGFVLHIMANLHAPAGDIFERFIYGAPAFAPLLFADLAMLGLLGLWGLLAVEHSAAAAGITQQEPVG